jgi:hypothetical protein
MSHEQTINQVYLTLEKTFTCLEQQCSLSEEMRQWRQTNEEWNIQEILEHVTLTSHFLLLVIRKSVVKALKRSRQDPLLSQESDLVALDHIGHPDAFPWLRPEHMEPTRQVTIEQIQNKLHEQGQECTSLLAQIPNGIGTLHTVRMSVRQLGRLDIYQWLYFLAQHGQRHNLEIERIKDLYSKTYSRPSK